MPQFRCKHCRKRPEQGGDVRSGAAWAGCTQCGHPAPMRPVHGRPPTPHDAPFQPTARNAFLRELNYHGYSDDTAKTLTPRTSILPEGARVRTTPPGQPTVIDLVEPGDTIEFNDRHMEHTTIIVAGVKQFEKYGLPTWSLCITRNRLNDDPLDCQDHGHLNEFVAQDGEIRKFFHQDPSVIHVTGKAPAYQARLKVTTG